MSEVKTGGSLTSWRFDKDVKRVTSSHLHTEAQLIMIESGLAVITMESGQWLLPAGRCGWIPAGYVHSMRASRKAGGLNLYLPSNTSQVVPSKPKVLSMTPLLREVALQIARDGSEVGYRERVNHLLAVLYDEVESTAELPLNLPLPKALELLKVTDALIQAPDAQPSMSTLARSAGMSERSLYRHFEQQTGLTIARWLQQLRMIVALEALADGKSVLDAALSVGYESPSAFNRVFKEALGLTPAQYRRSKHAHSTNAVLAPASIEMLRSPQRKGELRFPTDI